jgi:cell wall-associated NlpC family hydrolase
LGLLTLFSLSAATAARAKPVKPVGVRAWTSGSSTYIRARPGATVPPVAKVARHTPLYVWGKYNGWYRVETHDHIFGWVFNEYINSPDLVKVSEMPRTKAKSASNRTANQVMYGTPATLKKHYLTYGAPGALTGLKKQGVYLATAPKPVTKTRTLIAKASTPRIRERVVVEPVPPRAYTPRRTPITRTPVDPIEASPVPVVETPETLSPVTSVAPLPKKLPGNTGSGNTISTNSVSGNTISEARPTRSVEAGKIAGASRSVTPSARLFARAASVAAAQTAPEAPAASQPIPVVPVAPVVAAPVVVKTNPVAVARPKARVAAKPKIAKKAVAKKPVAKARPKSRYAASKEKKRQELRLRMGLSPASSPPSVIAPVSPVELMKAREEYLNSRKARLGTPAPVTPASPSVGVAPLPVPSGPLGGSSDSPLSPMPPAGISPMAFEGSPLTLAPLVADENVHPLYQLINSPQVIALAKMKPKAAAPANPAKAPTANAKPTGPLSARGGSPRDRMMSRGGSPRDRVGSGMATQALSYRGMPYIRGAASPSRGFDCSGLIYFLLRQRGYNPPRTAAGYRNWGQGVSRSQWKAGDLVLFANTYKRGISHIGVYLGEGKFVHAATTRTGVRVSSLNEAYYAKKYFGARRVK